MDKAKLYDFTMIITENELLNMLPITDQMFHFFFSYGSSNFECANSMGILQIGNEAFAK